MKNKRLLWGILVSISLLVFLVVGKPFLGTTLLVGGRGLFLVVLGFCLTGAKKVRSQNLPLVVLGYGILVAIELYYGQFIGMPPEVLWLLDQKVTYVGYLLIGVNLC